MATSKKKSLCSSMLEEMSKRGAAGIASTTKGRSRMFVDRTKYSRKDSKGYLKNE